VLSIDDAVRLALDRNQTLSAERLTIDQSKADEITAALKPNINASFNAEQLSTFSANPFSLSSETTNATYIAGLGYTFERGGKREKRMTVAHDTTDVTAKGVLDAERQLRFQTEQAFISVLLAKSVLDLSQQDLKDFSDVVDINRQRVTSGDLAEGDFLPISIQKLQFQTDVSSAEVGLLQAKATLRQLVGYESVTDTFDVSGDLTETAPALSLDDLKAQALQTRPDLAGAESSLTLANDQAALERGNRARDVSGSVDYTKVGGSNTLGVGVSFDLPFHDRNQGNIARADIGVQAAADTEAATKFVVLTDVSSAFAAFQSNQQIVKLYESGYLDQAKESLDITTYAFQRGAATLPNLLDAERTYRDTQIAYRQALAAFMTSARQLNLAVGKPVIP
jgi:cobalt-zinc-cadmium efflux system outer membrane protein